MAGHRLRIGYLIQQFPPEVGAGPARTVEMARRWLECGASVTAITAMPHGRLPGLAHGTVPAAYRGRVLGEESWDGIRVLRSWTYASPRLSRRDTIANNVSFMATALLSAVRAELDVLIASEPPFLPHVSGWLAAAYHRVPLVLEVRDLWPDYLVGLGLLRSGRPAAQALFGLERFLLRRANHVVAVTESFRRRLIAKGVPADRVTVIPNGVDLERYTPGPARSPPPRPELHHRGDEIVVGYLGTFGAGQGLETVVEAAALLQNGLLRVRFVLAGDGPQRQRVAARVRELGVRNITLTGILPRDATREFYAACDLCLVPLAPVDIFRDTVPSKLFEIMACGRPVIAAVEGEARALVEEASCGTAVSPGDPRELAETIAREAGRPEPERAAMGARGRAFVAERFDRRHLADRYLELLTRLARVP
ncbi:MAG: glycosyltransferase family 4 protein [Gemmatimonadales bacterium]